MFTYIKRYYYKAIPPKIQKLEKTMIKNASYTDHFQFSLTFYHSNILLKQFSAH